VASNGSAGAADVRLRELAPVEAIDEGSDSPTQVVQREPRTTISIRPADERTRDPEIVAAPARRTDDRAPTVVQSARRNRSSETPRIVAGSTINTPERAGGQPRPKVIHLADAPAEPLAPVSGEQVAATLKPVRIRLPDDEVERPAAASVAETDELEMAPPLRIRVVEPEAESPAPQVAAAEPERREAPETSATPRASRSQVSIRRTRPATGPSVARATPAARTDRPSETALRMMDLAASDRTPPAARSAAALPDADEMGPPVRMARARFSAGLVQRVRTEALGNQPPAPNGQPAETNALARPDIDLLVPLRDTEIVLAEAAGDRPVDWAAERFAEEPQLPDFPGNGRGWASSSLAWQAPSLCYGPLYFEEVALERYGHHYGCLQPVISTAHFFATVPALPYLVAAAPPCHCRYTLGHFRPGDDVPAHCNWPPPRPRGAAAAGGVAVGLIFLLP
jgi:hypothetical protein